MEERGTAKGLFLEELQRRDPKAVERQETGEKALERTYRLIDGLRPKPYRRGGATTGAQFYRRDENGIPTAWVTRMRESMALTPRFSTNRVVREYTERYLAAASAYRERAADKGATGLRVVDWRHALEQKWTRVRFGDVKVETDGQQHVFEIQVYLEDLDPKAVRIELYADGVREGAPLRQEMKRIRQLAGALAVTCIAQRYRRPGL
jgi:glucan phosphorylase